MSVETVFLVCNYGVLPAWLMRLGPIGLLLYLALRWARLRVTTLEEAPAGPA